MLSGDLTDFSLRDVLRLLATTGKSGLLTLHGAGGDGGVFLRDGGICLALVDVTRVPLGPRLIVTGGADRETVGAAARAADGTAFGLACALVRSVAETAAAAALVAEHTREAIGWLSQYFAATFEFDPTLAVDAWPLAPLPTDQVLTDVERDADQWADLRGVVDDLSLVPSCLPDRPTDGPLSLTPPQWRVVALIDGRRTVKEVAEAAGLGQLAAGRELAMLVRDGLVELVERGAASAVDVVLADVVPVDTFAISPAWLARDDDALAQVVPAAPADDPGDADDAPLVAVDEDPVGDAAPVAMPPPAGSAAGGGADAPEGAFTEPDDVGAEPDTAVAEPDAALIESDAAPDANLGLLHRLVGRARSS